MSEHVRVERLDGVLAITLARPERRNAITVAMYSALAATVEGAAADPSVRVITIRGEGQDFAAGNDLADFLNALPRDIDPWVRALPGVTLVDLASLQTVLATTEVGADVEAARGIVTQEASIHVSNVMVVDSDNKPTRVGYRKDEDGRSVRIARRSGKDI